MEKIDLCFQTMMKIQVSFCHLSPRQFINHVDALSALPTVFHMFFFLLPVGNRLLSTPNRFLPLPAGLQQKLCPGFHAPPPPPPPTSGNFQVEQIKANSEPNSRGFYYFCVRQFMQFSLFRSFVFSFYLYASSRQDGMLRNRKR